LKYYYQHDPTTAPFGFSSFQGFDQHLDAGSQVASITNTQSLSPHFSIAETFGSFAKNLQHTRSNPLTAQAVGINAFGSSVFPGITIADDFGNESPANTNFVFNAGANIGSTAASQGAFTGIFQNRWMPSVDASWIHGRHTITFGGSFSYTQLNARDRRTNSGMIGFTSFDQFLTAPHHVHSGRVHHTNFLQGDANRYYARRSRVDYSGQVSDRPNLSVTAGVRFDYHGGLIEKNGRIFTSTVWIQLRCSHRYITSNGLIIAGNNPDFATKGVSDSTLTGGSGASLHASAWRGVRSCSMTKSWFVRDGACTTIAANSSRISDHGGVWFTPKDASNQPDANRVRDT